MTRIIAKIEIKDEFVVKPVHFEGLRRVGQPIELVNEYHNQCADEVFYVDMVASLYQREIWFDQIKETAEELFVPFAVGGGVRSIDDFSKLFRSGADKVLINTFALQKDPSIIDRAANIFGAQSVVVNIEAKRTENNWDCCTDCGRIGSGRTVLDWALEAESRGAGEILLQSIDRDGRYRGFDIDLIGMVVTKLKIPVVAASGAKNVVDVKEVVRQCQPSGVAIASMLHYKHGTVEDIRNAINEK